MNDCGKVTNTNLELDQTSIQSEFSIANESRGSEPEPPDIILSEINFEKCDDSDRKRDTSTITEVNLDYGNPVSINLIDNIEQTSDKDMVSLQRACPDLSFLIDYLETRVMPEDDKKQRMCIRAEEQFVIKDGLLYRFYQPQYKGKTDLTGHYFFQLAIPKSKINDILYHFHDSLAGGGHFGVTRTFFKIRQKYWLPRMHQEIKKYVNACNTCQRTKLDRRRQPPPLNPLPVEDTLSRIHIDNLGPLPKTEQGYQYILLIIDSFSKWSEAFPLVSQNAQEVASVLYNAFICR